MLQYLLMAKDLKKCIEDTRKKYQSIGRVFCPMLNSYIFFTADGFNHLIYKPNRKKRNVAEQRYKIDLFGLVIPSIKQSKQLDQWRFVGDVNDDHDVQYYALVHGVGRKPIEVRVIIRRTGDGQFNFHSVMPHKNGGNKKSRIKRGS